MHRSHTLGITTCCPSRPPPLLSDTLSRFLHLLLWLRSSLLLGTGPPHLDGPRFIRSPMKDRVLASCSSDHDKAAVNISAWIQAFLSLSEVAFFVTIIELIIKLKKIFT